MKQSIKYSFVLFFVATTTSGQSTFEVKDRHGNLVLTISSIKLFRYSEALKETIPHFEGVLINESDEPLDVAIEGSLLLKNGKRILFPVGKIDLSLNKIDYCRLGCIFAAESAHLIGYPFPPPWFAKADVQSVEFNLPSSWESPEDRRVAAEAQTKKATAAAARRKRSAVEQQKIDAEARRKLRATCLILYQSTADKKIKDLTVREEQQIRACQTLGMYPPQ